MSHIHSGWDEQGLTTVEVRFACFDFTGRPEVFLDVLALPRVAELVFPASPFVGSDGSDAGIKSLPTASISDFREVDLDFWRRTNGLMCPVLHSRGASIGLRGWDPAVPLYPGLTTRKCSLDMSLDVPVRPSDVMTRSWMRELVSQVKSAFPADVARIFVTKVGDGEEYDTKTWTDERGFRRTEAAAWLTYLDAVSLAHVGRARVEKCSAHVEFDFFGGALLCTAEEPFSLHPRELYERTRKVNEELDQIEPPPPPGSPFRFRAQ